MKGRMVGQEQLDRDEQIAQLAGQFIAFIDSQTGSAPPAPEEVDADGLLAAFSALDESLDQMADLADVYGTDRMKAIEPLVFPAAALVGEYMRHAVDAVWIEPLIDPDTTLIIATKDDVAVDLTGAVKASLLSGMSNLKAMAARLIAPETE